MKPAAIFEASFDVCYLVTIFYIAISMFVRHGNNMQYTLFAWMCLLLGGGDCFHLGPRMYKLFFGESSAVTAAIGFGTLITAISMTIYYLLFLEVISLHYKKNIKVWRIVCYILFAIRIVTLVLPQNNWAQNQFNPVMSAIRNAPFFGIGIIIVVMLFIYSREDKHDIFRNMWLYVTISFGCYAPVALIHLGGMKDAILMIIKTIAYITIAIVGYRGLTPNESIESEKVTEALNPS